MYPLINRDLVLEPLINPKNFSSTTEPTLIEKEIKFMGSSVNTSTLVIFDAEDQQRKLYFLSDSK